MMKSRLSICKVKLDNGFVGEYDKGIPEIGTGIFVKVTTQFGFDAYKYGYVVEIIQNEEG